MQGPRAFLDRSRRNYVIAVAGTAVLIVLAVALTTGLLGGDSSPETFGAQDFVDAANNKGAGLVLGDPLISSQQDVDIYGLSFEGSADPQAGAGSGTANPGDEHGGASLTISKDSSAAMRVYEQCEMTGTFVCYRANNAALVFDEGTDPGELAKVDAAIRALAGG